MAEGQTYNIPESRFEWFKDQLAKLEKKAKRLIDPDARIFCTAIGFHFVDEEDRSAKAAKLRKQKIYEVFVSHPDVKLNGWQFIARIDHSQESGNVIRTVPGFIVPKRYRDSTPYCEHCNINRTRRDTFVLNYIGTDDYKQVGSSCLKDFVGHDDAAKLAKLAEFLAIIGDYAIGHGFSSAGGLNDYRWVNAEYYMALVADSIRTHGWISNKFAYENAITSTSNRAIAAFGEREDVSVEGKALAEKALTWARGFDEEDRELNDWEHNANVIAQSDALEFRHLGIAASIVGVYWAKFVKQPNHKVSSYIGNIRDKIEVAVTLKRVTPGQNSIRHAFEDAHGNSIVWFATNTNLGHLVDKQIVIKGTVQAHQEYNGRKQNIVNRVKIIS